MQKLSETIKPVQKQYSTVNNNNLNNSTVSVTTVLDNLTDVIPRDGYWPFYAKMFKQLGYSRFMELVQKARASSDTPQRLFCWMLKHNELVY